MLVVHTQCDEMKSVALRREEAAPPAQFLVHSSGVTLSKLQSCRTLEMKAQNLHFADETCQELQKCLKCLKTDKFCDFRVLKIV